MKVSVIVAAYNAEKYLRETLDSLFCQSMKDYEVIVVDDGSADGTGEILAEYGRNYPALRVIRQENKGPSAARNTGLAAASGEYVYFFDADDILEPDALDALCGRAAERKADLVIARYDIFDRFRAYPVHELDCLVREKKIGKYDPRILWTFSLCNKLFRREIIEAFSLCFPPVSYSEDGAFLMEYVYRCRRITGLDKVVFHYRRAGGGENASITASPSPEKIRDYIEAHRRIEASMAESFQRDILSACPREYLKNITRDNPSCPFFPSWEQMLAARADIRGYRNELIRKEIHILLNQFYAQFWGMEEETVSLLADEIEEKLAALDMKGISLLQNDHPEFSLERLPRGWAEALSQARFTAVLYGEPGQADFRRALGSLLAQNLALLVIVVPAHMREDVLANNMMRGNVRFEAASSERELFYRALDRAETPYIAFGDPRVSYAGNAFKYELKNFLKLQGDFIIELIYHRNYGDMQPVLLNRMALDSLKAGYEKNPFLALDHTLANKFFRVEFLRKFSLDRSRHLRDHLGILYEKGYYPFMNDGVVFYEDREENFPEFVGTKDTLPFIRACGKEGPADLSRPELAPDLKEALPKLPGPPGGTFSHRILKKALSLMRRRPLKDQVLFVTIRKNGALEGNAKALYPYVKGKKIVCARMLPHSLFTELRMSYHLCTSKVIVTDDYVKYLRYFPLREEQRVVQLWHACGAFKKFGQRGTNLSVFLDNATHAQYSVMTVSGQRVRPIYADAFNIRLDRVMALGCPRTDRFFDKEWLRKNREKIYARHPEWRGRSLILYAPTFRDEGGDRSRFCPALDFDRLSRELLPDQMFLVCPHPVVKNRVVRGEYGNIREVREFSTGELMPVSDVLITDYSSVIFEYALLQKPMAFYCYDRAGYSRGFYLNYPDDLPGEVYETQEELTRFIRSAKERGLSERARRFAEDYMSACDGHSSERIAGMINAYREGEANGRE